MDEVCPWKKINPGRLRFAGLIIGLLVLVLPAICRADGLKDPERSGLALTVGHTYDPEPTFGFIQLTGLLQYDYDKVWHHPAPDPLYFKLEGSLGLARFQAKQRLMTSVNMLAQYYLAPADHRFRPYVEAGIGLIYTDYQVEGQGLRINFNPLAGIGCDWRWESGPVFFANFRLHHLSNGGLNHDNRGTNSVLLQVGRYF